MLKALSRPFESMMQLMDAYLLLAPSGRPTVGLSGTGCFFDVLGKGSGSARMTTYYELGMRNATGFSIKAGSSGYTFSTISHTPQGHMPAQKPQPMHLSSSTTYSYAPPSCSTLLMAPQ